MRRTPSASIRRHWGVGRSITPRCSATAPTPRGYSNGIVAIEVSDPTQPQRVGQFVPDTSRRHANSLGVGPAEMWGLAIDPETGIVYASDMRTGLWIIQPTGPAAPSS